MAGLKTTMVADNTKPLVTKIPEAKLPVIPNTLNMHVDFNLYDSDRNSDDLSSRSETSAYFPSSNRPLAHDTPLTTTDNTPVKPITNESASNNASNKPLLFKVDTIRECSDAESITLHTPNPNNSDSQNIASHATNPNSYNYRPRGPEISGFTTPSTMTPLFGNSREPSIEYVNTPGLTPNISIDSNQAAVGLNYSNENLWRSRFISASDVQSTNWTQQRQIAEESMRQRYLEDTLASQKREDMTSLTYVVPKELEVKKGLFGKIKLAFNLIDSKVEAKISNLDSIAIKYHDKGKRKLFWTIWEKKSGYYESYEDFKRSWDPKTDIWAEIKSRTNNDVRGDVEGLLGVGRNRPVLDSSSRRGIQPRNVEVISEVNQLIRERQPFAPTSIEDTTANSPEKHRTRNKSHSHHHRKHSSHSHGRRHRNK